MGSMFAIYDSMQHIRSAIHPTCIGMSAPAASLILPGGEATSRSMIPHGR